MAYQLTTAKVWDGSQWVDAEGGGLEFASISATTGSPATGTFTDSDGFEWQYYDFTGNGSITFDSAGYVDALVVGGGAGSNQSTGSGRTARAGGGAGVVRRGPFYFEAGTYALTIGAGGAGTTGAASGAGSASTLGSEIRAAGGDKALSFYTNVSTTMFNGNGGHGGGVWISTTTSGNSHGSGAYGTPNTYNGLTLNYNGSDIEYGVGGYSATPVANTGSGGVWTAGSGTSGRIIVKVPA